MQTYRLKVLTSLLFLSKFSTFFWEWPPDPPAPNNPGRPLPPPLHHSPMTESLYCKYITLESITICCDKMINWQDKSTINWLLLKCFYLRLLQINHQQCGSTITTQAPHTDGRYTDPSNGRQHPIWDTQCFSVDSAEECKHRLID